MKKLPFSKPKKETMKQHITIEQLNELSNKDKFRKHFWKIYDGDLLVYGDYKGNIEKEIHVFEYGMIPADESDFGYKLLSIGQMMDFLENSNPTYYTNIFMIHEDGQVQKGYAGELCDALWEDVKELLEHEKTQVR